VCPAIEDESQKSFQDLAFEASVTAFQLIMIYAYLAAAHAMPNPLDGAALRRAAAVHRADAAGGGRASGSITTRKMAVGLGLVTACHVLLQCLEATRTLRWFTRRRST